jgi:ubiquinone/menaquinone biosynthesis C-methylase UbiE
MTDVSRASVIGFYDTHPINEDEILAKLRAKGLALDGLTEAELCEFDQDHYGGLDAVQALADAAGIAGRHRVLDVCSGMGGPARWLAHTRGCRVTGLDFTRSRVEGARRLTARVGLEQLVDFVEGDATAMPLADAGFDVAIAQEGWCHIADKPALIAEVARVLAPGGTLAFTDIVVIGDFTRDDAMQLAEAMKMPQLGTAEIYARLLQSNGFAMRETTDLSTAWKTILQARLQMYRSLRDTTVARFGEARYAEYDEAYAFFVNLFVQGKLGGVRMVARRGR